MAQPYLLMAPGPVQMSPEVLRILAEPMIHHRTPEFETILAKVLRQLPEVFETRQPVFIQCATGSGGMESSIVNALSPGDQVLCIVAGKFGERWREICQVYGMEIVSYDVPWGQSAEPAVVKKLLNENPRVRAVLIQACETSTGIFNPIKEIAAFVHDRPETIMMVDAITACGVTELPMDDWHLDVVVAASQKAFMLPTGLAFLSFSPKAWKFAQLAKCPRLYWDLRTEFENNKKSATHFSSSVPLIKGLSHVLDEVLKSSSTDRARACEALARGIRAGGAALGFKLYAQHPSPTVTALVVPEGLEGEKIQRHIEAKYRVTIVGGQEKLKNKIIRIGSMGAIGPNDVTRTMQDLARTVIDLGGKADVDQVTAKTRAAMNAPASADPRSGHT
jgi:aspartate aminotransferase-like enzyme